MVSQTVFRSDETFTQESFRLWLDERPASDLNHYELLNGRIVMTPPAGWPHGRLEATLVRIIGAHVEATKSGLVLGSSTGYDLPSGDTVEPDVSFIAQARFDAGPPPERGRFLRIVPTLIVEILSPATAKRDRTEKRAIYARNGIDEYWLVDPDRQNITVYTLTADSYDDGHTVASGVLPSAVLPDLHLRVDDVCAPA